MSAALLETWERGLACPGPARASVLHQAARPSVPAKDLDQLPIGVREIDLFDLRRALFGDRMEVLAECAACHEKLEFELSAAALAAAPAPDAQPLRVADDGWEVSFRAPAAGDVSEAASRWELIARCIIAASHDGKPVEADHLPPSIQTMLAEAAERADPAGARTLRVACPDCGAATSLELDIAGYLWAELDFWARDLLLDVHVLAGAYGWSEPEVLALSPARRRYYLGLCADA